MVHAALVHHDTSSSDPDDKGAGSIGCNGTSSAAVVTGEGKVIGVMARLEVGMNRVWKGWNDVCLDI